MSRRVGTLCAIMSIMSKVIEYPKSLPPMTGEEKAESKRIIAEAKAAGHPLAQYAGIFMDDPSFDEWVEEMRLYRQRVEEEPEFWHDSPS